MTITARPDIIDPEPWRFPQPTSRRLSNGMELVLYDLPGQHVISATLVLAQDLATEPAEKEGVTTLLARLLFEGTVTHPGGRLAEALESCGATMGQQVSLYGMRVTMDAPATHLAPALSLMAEAVREPDCAEPDVARHLRLRLAEIARLRKNSAALAHYEFQRRVLAETDRASRPIGGSPSTIGALTADDVRERADAVLSPEGATIVIGGDIENHEALLALVDSCFGSWVRPVEHVAPPPLHPGKPGVTVIDRPGAVQADVRIGGWSIDRTDPRWPELRIAGHIMGGTFTSRLNSVLREERGLTYGIQLGLDPQREGGTWAAGGSFRSADIGCAITLLHDLLRIDTAPFTPEEVGSAQRHLISTAPLQFATAGGVVDRSTLQILLGLPHDHLDHEQEALRSVNAEAATRAYSEIIDTDRLTCVIVGDAHAVVPQLIDAGFVPYVVTARDPGETGQPPGR